MAAHPKPLTDLFVNGVLRPGKYHDIHGLYVLVRKTGSKYFEQRYTYRGHRRTIGLGPYPRLSLAKARDEALKNRRLVRSGIDPILERQRGPIPTFAQASAAVHDLRRVAWSGSRMSVVWTRTLEIHVFPHIGDRRVTELDTRDFLDIVKPLMDTQIPTAETVRYLMSTTMQWAYISGFCPDNPAGERLSAGLPRVTRKKKPHPAVPHERIASFLKALRGADGYITWRLGLELLILTATRSGEVRGAVWEEIDLDKAIWIIPAGRMKTRIAHRVPLGPEALAVLFAARELGDGTGLVFPSQSGGEYYAQYFSGLVHDLGFKAVPHGFRSTFKTWCEDTGVSWYLSEACLAHKLPSPVERAYARSDLFLLRRDLMNNWGTFVCSGVAGNVPPGEPTPTVDGD